MRSGTGAGVRAVPPGAVGVAGPKLCKQVVRRGAAALAHGADAAPAADDAPPRAGDTAAAAGAAAVAVPPGHAGAALPEPLHHPAVRSQHAAAPPAAVAAALGVRHRVTLLHSVGRPAGDAGGQSLVQSRQAAAADQRIGHGATDARNRILSQSHTAPTAPCNAAPTAAGHFGWLQVS